MHIQQIRAGQTSSTSAETIHLDAAGNVIKQDIAFGEVQPAEHARLLAHASKAITLIDLPGHRKYTKSSHAGTSVVCVVRVMRVRVHVHRCVFARGCAVWLLPPPNNCCLKSCRNASHTGLLARHPSAVLLTVSAAAGLSPMAKYHLQLAIGLDLPVFAGERERGYCGVVLLAYCSHGRVRAH